MVKSTGLLDEQIAVAKHLISAFPEAISNVRRDAGDFLVDSERSLGVILKGQMAD